MRATSIAASRRLAWIIGGWLLAAGAAAQGREAAPTSDSVHTVPHAPQTAETAKVAPPTASTQQAPPIEHLELQRPALIAEPERTTVWYGWQTLLADAMSVLLRTIGSDSRSPPLMVVGFAGLVLAAPAVHLAQGNPWAALGSFALRAGSMALIYAGVGAVVSADGYDSDGDELIAAGVIGLLAAVVLDALVFSYAEAPRAPGAGRKHVRVAIAPFAAPRARAAGVGVALRL